MESIAQNNLERQGYKTWMPKLTLRKRRKTKWTSVVEPMFSGYVFIQLVLGKDDPAPIRSTYGCRGLVRFGVECPPVPEELIAALYIVSQNAVLQASDHDSIFKSGEWVRLEGGPLAGLRALFDMPSGQDRARVLIDLMGAKRSVEVRIDDLGPVD